MFTRFIHIPTFIVSFLIGLLFVYISAPASTTVFVYPTPDNIDKFGYRDQAGSCFEYNIGDVSCPTDPTKIKNIPVQMGSRKQETLPMTQTTIGNSKINKI